MRSATRRGVIAAAFLLGLGLPGVGARADGDPPARQETPTGADQETSGQRSDQEGAPKATPADDPDPAPGAGGMELAADPSPDPSAGPPATKPGPSAEARSLSRARRQWLESIWHSP